MNRPNSRPDYGAIALVVAAIAFIILLMATTGSRAQAPQIRPQPPHCAPVQDALANLKKDYGEVVVWTGKAPPNTLVLMTLNATSGSWTVVYVSPDGKACAKGAGRQGQMIETASQTN